MITSYLFSNLNMYFPFIFSFIYTGTYTATFVYFFLFPFSLSLSLFFFFSLTSPFFFPPTLFQMWAYNPNSAFIVSNLFQKL